MATAQRVLVGVAVIATVAIVALYLAIIRSQGGGEPSPPDVLTVPFVAGYMLLMALLLAASLVLRAPMRLAFRGAASAGLLALGVLSLFSIGVALLIAGGIATASTVLAVRDQPAGRPVFSPFVGGVVAVALLVVGFEFAWHYLVCPPTGEMGGTTAGFFNSVSYDCNNGVLTTH